MSIELITGASSTPHISANDYRAVNRSNYGQGRYVLRDAEEMRVSVAPASGIIVIDTGSVMWYGMHIRCESDTTLNYTPPTAATPVYVYMHYVKEASTGYESVDWVVSVGEQKTENNTPADNVIDAYTLFASFTHNPTTQTADNLTTHFVLIDSHDDFNMPTIRAEIEAKHTEAKQYTDKLRADSSLSKSILASRVSISTYEITLEEALYGQPYQYVEFRFRLDYNGQHITSVLVPVNSIHPSPWVNNISIPLGGKTYYWQFRISGKTITEYVSADSNIYLADVILYGFKG